MDLNRLFARETHRRRTNRAIAYLVINHLNKEVFRNAVEVFFVFGMGYRHLPCLGGLGIRNADFLHFKGIFELTRQARQRLFRTGLLFYETKRCSFSLFLHILMPTLGKVRISVNIKHLTEQQTNTNKARYSLV